MEKDLVQMDYEDLAALVTTGAAAGIAVTKVTGHSRALGAVTGIAVTLLFYGVLKRRNKQ